MEESFESTTLHFERLFQSYASPILVLNLIKRVESVPRETVVGQVMDQAMEYVQQQSFASGSISKRGPRLEYCTYDFLNAMKANEDVVDEVTNRVTPVHKEIGLFHFQGSSLDLNGVCPETGTSIVRPQTEQHGVIRVNCIDCLDRTNVAQFCIGKLALRRQLHCLGVLQDQQNLEVECPQLLSTFRDMFTEHGDRIVRYSCCKSVTLIESQSKWWRLRPINMEAQEQCTKMHYKRKRNNQL